MFVAVNAIGIWDLRGGQQQFWLNPTGSAVSSQRESGCGLVHGLTSKAKIKYLIFPSIEALNTLKWLPFYFKTIV